MFEQLKKANYEKFQKNFEKRTKLAQEIGNAATLEEANSLVPQMKVLEDELKEIDTEQGHIGRYAEIFKSNPQPESPVKAKKSIGLT